MKHWELSGEDNGMFGMTGEDNPHWKGGATKERQSLYASQQWKKVVSEVYERDEAKCQDCGRLKNKEGEFHVHHIKSFAEHPALRTEIDNLILLCRECHVERHRGGDSCGD